MFTWKMAVKMECVCAFILPQLFTTRWFVNCSAYQNNDITEFEKILKTNRETIMEDPFIREHIEGELVNADWRKASTLYLITSVSICHYSSSYMLTLTNL